MTILLFVILGTCGAIWVCQGIYIFAWGVVRLIRNITGL